MLLYILSLLLITWVLSFNLNCLFDHISSISKSCFSHFRDLRRIRPNLDLKTANTIDTALFHSKLDYTVTLSSSIFLLTS